MKALIAGGGIAGTAAALALAQDGWAVDVFEQAEALTEVGAGLQLSPNVCRVLAHLDVLPALRECSSIPQFAELRDGQSGKAVYRTELGPAAEARWGAPYLHVHRADLLAVLTDAALGAGAKLHLGHEVIGAESSPEKASLKLQNGQSFEGDLLLGADGIRSGLRSMISSDKPPRYAGQRAWRGLIPAERLAVDRVPTGAIVWMGRGRHLVCYPVRRGKLINFVAVIDQEGWADEGWRQKGDPDALRAAFAGWADPVPSLLDAVTDCFLWGLFERPDQSGWSRDRIALIGDAAHPMKPFLAQGAAMAIEDSAALQLHLSREGDIPRALQAWEQSRHLRVRRVVRQSQANGRLFHLSNGITRAAVYGGLGLLSHVAPRLAMSQLDWLYGHDVYAGA